MKPVHSVQVWSGKEGGMVQEFALPDPNALRAQGKAFLDLADVIERTSHMLVSVKIPVKPGRSGLLLGAARVIYRRVGNRSIAEAKIRAAVDKLPRGARLIVEHFQTQERATTHELATALSLSPKSVGNYLRELRKLRLVQSERVAAQH